MATIHATVAANRSLCGTEALSDFTLRDFKTHGFDEWVYEFGCALCCDCLSLVPRRLSKAQRAALRAISLGHVGETRNFYDNAAALCFYGLAVVGDRLLTYALTAAGRALLESGGKVAFTCAASWAMNGKGTADAK